MSKLIKRSFNTPYINIWNPICKKYMWVRIIHCFIEYNKKIKSHLDVNGNKDYEIEDNIYMVNVSENNFCKCNQFLVCSEELIFRVPPYYKSNKWVDKIKFFPEPNLGKINVYTNKYKGFDMLELYKKAQLKYPKQIKIPEPNLICTCNELK